jgi:Holliday junction resolvase RusA-like endonuclease
MVHRIVIPNWQPARLNQFADKSWHVRSRLKAADKNMVAHYARQADVAPPEGRRKVSLVVVLRKGQRAPDTDAYWKSLLDALVKAGVLIDDNRNGCLTGDVEFQRSRDDGCETTIIVEDVEPAPKIRKVPKARKGRVA